MSPTIMSVSEITFAPRLRLVSGYCFSSLSATVLISAAAAATVTPSLSLPTPRQSTHRRLFFD